MMLPLRELSFPNGLVVPVRTVKLTRWQYHLLKHPLGVNRDARNTGDDPEGWGELEPAVVEPGWRAQVFSELSAVSVDSGVSQRAGGVGRCELPEVRGNKPRKLQAATYACHDCPEAVVRLCEQATHGERPIGVRYADVAHAVLDGLAGGTSVSRSEYTKALFRHAHQLDIVRAASVLAVGTLPAQGGVPKLVARFLRGDGVTLEFFVHQGGRTATWRTMYRVRCTNTSLIGFLARLPISTGDALSETCVVARQWWERHGI